jgi:hypothetical protein
MLEILGSPPGGSTVGLRLIQACIHKTLSEVLPGMKKWRRFLARFLLGFGLVMILIISMLYVLLWQYSNSGCGYTSRIVSPGKGPIYAVVDEKCCGWGCVNTVKLHNKEVWWGLESPIFVYYPSNSVEPVVKWLSPTELEISLDQAPKIDSQKMEMWGVKIIYRIGTNNP